MAQWPITGQTQALPMALPLPRIRWDPGAMALDNRFLVLHAAQVLALVFSTVQGGTLGLVTAKVTTIAARADALPVAKAVA